MNVSFMLGITFETYHFFFHSTLTGFSSFVIKRSFSNVHKDDARRSEKKFRRYSKEKKVDGGEREKA